MHPQSAPPAASLGSHQAAFLLGTERAPGAQWRHTSQRVRFRSLALLFAVDWPFPGIKAHRSRWTYCGSHQLAVPQAQTPELARLAQGVGFAAAVVRGAFVVQVRVERAAVRPQLQATLQH